MLCGAGNFLPQVAKCEMFLHYLAKQKDRCDDSDPLERKLSFIRRKIETRGTGAEDGAAVCKRTRNTHRNTLHGEDP